MQLDNRHQAEPAVTPDQAIRLCDRNFGIGGDGVRAPSALHQRCSALVCTLLRTGAEQALAQVIFALPPVNGADYAMRIFNSDGSEPEMCGNGIRCLAKFVADIDGVEAARHRVDTLGGGRTWECLACVMPCIDGPRPATLGACMHCMLCAPLQARSSGSMPAAAQVQA